MIFFSLLVICIILIRAIYHRLEGLWVIISPAALSAKGSDHRDAPLQRDVLEVEAIFDDVWCEILGNFEMSQCLSTRIFSAHLKEDA